jgi:hypothetical protein
MSLSNLEFQSNLGSMDASELDWLPRFDTDSPIDDIRHELESKGVMHVRGVLNRETVLEARRK